MQVEDIRTVIIDGEKWYVGRDIASVLGYKKTRDTVRNRVNSRYKRKYEMLTNRVKQPCIIINNNGLEQLISSSRMPNTINIAKKLDVKVNKIWQKPNKVEDIRTVMLNGQKWYVGSDVGRALGYADPSDAVQAHVANEDKKQHKILINNQEQDIIIINKHGLEVFVSSSTMPNSISVAEKLGIQLNYMLDTYRGQNIRNVMIDGKLWFAGKDVTKILGYKNLQQAIYYHANKEDRMSRVVISGNHPCKMVLINKHGIESLVSSSITPNAISVAKKFNINVNYMLNTYRGQNIRNVMIDGKQWFVAKDVAKILEYKDPETTILRSTSKEDRMSRAARSGNHLYNMALINKHGLEELISKSTMPNALDIAKKLGINVNHILNTRKEQDSIHAILKTFKGENMLTQYSVGTYRIDLYFPDYKLAIECDEYDHSDRDQEYEQTRQHYIEDKLGCKFIRYNPDSKNYNIFNVLNKIYKEMSK